MLLQFIIIIIFKDLGERFYLQTKCLSVILLMSVLCNFFLCVEKFKNGEKKREKELVFCKKGRIEETTLDTFFFFPFPRNIQVILQSQATTHLIFKLF